MHGAYYKWDSADLFLSCVDSMCECASVRVCECATVRVRSLSSSSLFISIHSGTGESLSLFMSKRKAPESRQTGIESFLPKSKRTEANGGSDK